MKKTRILLIFALLFILFYLNQFFALDFNQGGLNVSFFPQLIRFNSPQNTTYNFSIGDNYTMQLSASSGFLLHSWNYTLFGLKHGLSKFKNISIGGESSSLALDSFEAYRWSNRLTIYGTDVNGQIHTNSVVFFVKIPNSAPLIENISENLYVCENNRLSYFFRTYEIDEETLYMDISPKSPFYIASFLYSEPTRLVSEIYSGILRKSTVGIHEEIVSASDGEYSDIKNINITVIGINNAPLMGNIGVQTVASRGENSTFDKNVSVSDVEDGNQTSGNFNFTIDFTGNKLFDIGPYGNMYFLANESYTGVYNISVCVQDKGIGFIHPNISLCSQNGSSIKTCQNFSLTVTNENRAPAIVDYNPKTLSLNVSRGNITSFNITKYDPDTTIPDSYWYLDNVLISYQSGSLIDFLNYSFTCGVADSHRIKVEITDGLLNDSITWNLNVLASPCPIPSGSSGGGGGISCIPQLACKEWAVCQNLKRSLEIGLISGEDFRIIKFSCDKKDYDSTNCGIQIRGCNDLKNCSRFVQRNESLQECFFSVNPSCFDGIKNCHDEGCELLVDCGGPCASCPTCSDGILNQGEEGIDCGGPCPISCPIKIEKQQGDFYSFFKLNGLILLYVALIILIIVSIILLLRRISYIRAEKRRIVYKYMNKPND